MSALGDERAPSKEALPGTAFGSGAMFDRIAARYDVLNRILSLGIDRRWRRHAVRALALPAGSRVLDLATGTGDVALEVLRQHPDARVLGLDPSLQMLAIGRRKVRQAGLVHQAELLYGDAQDLPYADRSFDGVTIAFGIRNVPDRSRALAEMARVTRRGGRIAILELMEPRQGVLAPLARAVVRSLVPHVGALLSGASEYRYLQRSMAAFPAPDEFVRQMRQAGLEPLAAQPMTMGVVCLFVARPAKPGGDAA
ncbi:MAG: bifunctional demethylmenaquinone methyltransferase/2-methoxy-6-polyprenyl-1,4-benzoquinol methylase UbiE [Acidobacteria bacterium]|nr:bifunctional demethylmenaquinone methyltransferase/2-methoxy-6-polyprenyl-1,4-benzoquinol methylase UbiE [Acidobacteriota bacterium]